MATREYIESLYIEDNVFALKEDKILNYLVHYAAPFTGAGQITVPAGTKFAAHRPMRSDALYMHLIEEDEDLYKKMTEKEKVNIPQLAYRLAGFSFFITKEEVENLALEFLKGSKARLLEIFELLKTPPVAPQGINPESTSVTPQYDSMPGDPGDLPF